MGDETCIQLRGSAEWEMNETMEKVDGLASVMLTHQDLTDAPYLATMVLAPQNDSLSYCVEC
ncbi:hypothetical protein N7504_011334 [Penicillium tannophilum]|nr:hypothetical protein N7504_011334 [Penicillium tannophilum]